MYTRIIGRFIFNIFGKSTILALDKVLVNQWVLSIIPKRPVRDHLEYSMKMEQHFLIKPGQRIGMALAAFYSISNFPYWGGEPFCQKWNSEFGLEYSNRNKWTTSRGDPQYSCQKKPKRTLPFEFQPKYLESLT